MTAAVPRHHKGEAQMSEAGNLKTSSTPKRDKFVSLAESRTANAIRSIRLIANLGNRNAYEFGDLDVKKITNALTAEVEAVRVKMSAAPGRKSDIDFKL
jgi:hypothetical protein